MLRQAFDELAGRWETFTRSEPAIQADRLERCRTGVGRRRESGSDSGSSGGSMSFD